MHWTFRFADNRIQFRNLPSVFLVENLTSREHGYDGEPESPTITEEMVSLLPESNKITHGKIFVDESLNWEEVALLKFMTLLEGLSLDRLQLFIPEHLAVLEPIQEGFARLMLKVPKGATLESTKLTRTLPLAIGRAISNGNVGKVTFDATTFSQFPTGGGFRAMLESESVELFFNHVDFECTAFTEVVEALTQSTTVAGLRCLGCNFLESAIAPVALHQAGAVKTKTMTKLEIDGCCDALCRSLSSLFDGNGAIVVELLGSKITPHTFPIFGSTKHAQVLCDESRDLHHLPEALLRYSTILETLELYPGDNANYFTVEPRLFDTIETVISNGVLKHIVCPASFIAGRVLDGPWERLASLELRGGQWSGGFVPITSEEASSLSSSLVELATSSSSLVKLVTGFEFDGDKVSRLQQLLTQNSIGLTQLGHVEDIDDVIQVLHRVRDVNETLVAGIRGDGVWFDPY